MVRNDRLFQKSAQNKLSIYDEGLVLNSHLGDDHSISWWEGRGGGGLGNCLKEGKSHGRTRQEKKQFKTENKNIGQDKKSQKSSVHLPSPPSPPPIGHMSRSLSLINDFRISYPRHWILISLCSATVKQCKHSPIKHNTGTIANNRHIEYKYKV